LSGLTRLAHRSAWPSGARTRRGRSRPCRSWQPQGEPATQPHEYVRGGTCKILTLFHPASGQVHLQPVSSCTNPVLHGWLKERLEVVLATLPPPAALADATTSRAAWEAWQAGLTVRFNLPAELPPLRMLLVWDNLAGHKTPEMVVWLCEHGVMPLYTPLGGSWLNMGGVHPADPQAPYARRPASTEPDRDRHLVRADRTSVEPASHTLPVEWQAPAKAAQAAQ
jgi:hypothetical protein